MGKRCRLREEKRENLTLSNKKRSTKNATKKQIVLTTQEGARKLF